MFEVVLVSGKKTNVLFQKDTDSLEVLQALRDEWSSPIDQQRLMFNGKEVVGVLEDNGIQEGSILQLIVMAKHADAR